MAVGLVIMRTYISFVAVGCLALAAWFFCVHTVEKKQPCQENVLSNLTPHENRSLSRICRGLLYSSSLGYTLFGDKPVSFISIYRESRIDDEQSFFQKSLISILRTCRQPIESACFAIVFEKTSRGEDIYLINKKAFLNAVERNLSLFQTLLEKKLTPQELLQDILQKGLFEPLQGNHALFGIVLGFGRQNALNFDRRCILHPPLDGIPPWKETYGTRCLVSQNKDFFLREWLRSISLKKGDSLPCSSFTTVQEALDELDKKLLPSSSEEDLLCSPTSIPLPPFACDPTSQETQALIKKYTATKAYLEIICNNDTFFEIAIKKFFANEE